MTTTPEQSEEAQALAEATKPWADFHGDLPDFDHPLRCVFDSGVQYAVELLAKELGVEDWDVCDGTEEFDGDLGGTMMNIVCEALPKDEHGDRMFPSDVRAAFANRTTANPTVTESATVAGAGGDFVAVPRSIVDSLLDLEAPAEHATEPLSSDLLGVIDSVRVLSASPANPKVQADVDAGLLGAQVAEWIKILGSFPPDGLRVSQGAGTHLADILTTLSATPPIDDISYTGLGPAGGERTSIQIERDWIAIAARPCETEGLEDMEAGCCAPCRARAALSMRETLAEAFHAIDAALETSDEVIEWAEPIRASKRGQADDDELRKERKNALYGMLDDARTKLRARLALSQGGSEK